MCELITNEQDRRIAERASHNLDDPGEAWRLHEPSDLDWAVADRLGMGLPAIGPLTLKETEGVAAYEQYMEESAREYEEQERAGGRTICPKCGNRSVKHSTVCTYGYPGHPGADYSDYGVCETEGCDHKEL